MFSPPSLWRHWRHWRASAGAAGALAPLAPLARLRWRDGAGTLAPLAGRQWPQKGSTGACGALARARWRRHAGAAALARRRWRRWRHWRAASEKYPPVKIPEASLWRTGALVNTHTLGDRSGFLSEANGPTTRWVQIIVLARHHPTRI